MQKYFLTTSCNGDIHLEPEIVSDTKLGLMHQLKAMDSMFPLLGLRNILNTSSSLTSPYGTNLFLDHQTQVYSPKAHYHIVFKEKGITIHHIAQLHDVLDTLVDIVDGSF